LRLFGGHQRPIPKVLRAKQYNNGHLAIPQHKHGHALPELAQRDREKKVNPKAVSL
jgi:hypothetical protein